MNGYDRAIIRKFLTVLEDRRVDLGDSYDYRPALTHFAEMYGILDLVQALRRALEHKELSVDFVECVKLFKEGGPGSGQAFLEATRLEVLNGSF